MSIEFDILDLTGNNDEMGSGGIVIFIVVATFKSDSSLVMIFFSMFFPFLLGIGI